MDKDTSRQRGRRDETGFCHDVVMTDWAQLYLDNVHALEELAPLLNGARDLTVPATPLWSVHGVVAHLAGGSSDLLSGRMDDAPSDRWTARHVAERAGTTIQDLMIELGRNCPPMVEVIRTMERPALVWDIAVHHADLREALDLTGADQRFWEPILTVMRRRLGDKGPAFGHVGDYELFRAIFSRRSRGQLRSWGTGLTDAELEDVGIFGPRDDDQPVPGSPR